MKAMNPGLATAVDAEHPWLGLVSFTEETRRFFHGREEEVAELGRRVQRKLLTVLFGQSGLGKTSILQAGLVPRLRPEGFCPVYVRLDYDPNSPPPAEQIKRALFRATESAGTWTRSGSAVAGETLWEFLHHRDDVLQDAAGRPLLPLLIFDQFEEIFTLAQADEAGRRRAQEFLQDLADLVENRPPASLEARIDRDEADAARFDFARADYRIVLSLREDYLAHLEGLKDRMPSVTQNRMRLARMTGAQALAAVRRPAPGLVSEAVAESIVRFVAGGAALAVAEVEPSLLSLICRELNNARVAGGHSEISADLLAGSRDTILTEFYERALADQPAGVRAFLEDHMLTESGFRESVGEERVRKAFVAAGAPEDALARLVDRRLLRTEDRLDQRRVEITHDVLCSVILTSRNVRREREALAETERQLAAQREREAATRRSLARARLVAAVAVVLMLGAIGSAVFGWINLRRARDAGQAAVAAERRAAEIGRFADTARGEAEKLVSYLVDDFYRQLLPTGRVEIVADLAGRAAAYYRNLPQELRTPETERNHGLTLARHGAALTSLNRTDDAAPVLDEAVRRLEALGAAGDRSPETARGLALALRSQGNLLQNQNLVAESLQTLERAESVLRPVATAPGASWTARREFGVTLVALGFQSQRTSLRGAERALPFYAEARRLYDTLLAEDPNDEEALAGSAFVDVRAAAAQNLLGRPDEALRLAQAGAAGFEDVLSRNPGYLTAINARGIAVSVQSIALAGLGRLSEALVAARQGEAAYTTYVQVDRNAGVAWSNLLSGQTRVANTLYSLGRVREAIQALRGSEEVEGKLPMTGALANTLANRAAVLAVWQSEVGDVAGSERQAAEAMRHFVRSAQDERQEGIIRLVVNDLRDLLGSFVRSRQPGQEAEVIRLAQPIAARYQALPVKNDFERGWKATMVGIAHDLVLENATSSGRWAEAERAAHGLLALRLETGVRNDVDRGEVAEAQVGLSLALARQGRRDEARAALAPAQAFYAEMLPRHRENQLWIAAAAAAQRALYHALPEDAASLPARRAAVAEARRLLSQLSAEFLTIRVWRDLQAWAETAESAP
jgi:tetratricopeptide (TPR) repeat protein